METKPSSVFDNLYKVQCIAGQTSFEVNNAYYAKMHTDPVAFVEIRVLEGVIIHYNVSGESCRIIGQPVQDIQL